MAIKTAFQGTNVRVADIRKALEQLQLEYSNPTRGVTLEEVAGGFQLRTKADNLSYLRQTVKARPFKLSGQALEVLSIVAYKQPCIKSTVDEIRGVESGHLMRGLLDRGVIRFAGKSELPGRPMLYETTKKFLEIFTLRNLKELPSLSEIDQILPDGIGEVEEEKETLSDLTGQLSNEIGTSYSQAEEELVSITAELGDIATTTEFFEAEKKRQKDDRDLERARDIRERVLVGESVTDWESKWLARFEEVDPGQP
jgi:segregation and condensation protein B